MKQFYTLLTFAGSFLVQQQQQMTQEKLQEIWNNSSPSEKLFLILTYMDFDLAEVVIGIVLVFLAAVLIMLFFRRWNVSRMGYFFVTVCAFGVRVQNPTDKFWTCFAFMAGLFSFGMFIYSHKHVEFDSRKEPLYFLFNGFALMCIAFPLGGKMDFFMAMVGLIALISSLFFVVTKKHVPRNKKLGRLEADQAILNSLEKKKNRAV